MGACSSFFVLENFLGKSLFRVLAELAALVWEVILPIVMGNLTGSNPFLGICSLVSKALLNKFVCRKASSKCLVLHDRNFV